MSTTSSVTAPAPNATNPLQAYWHKHYHLIRRLHSLSGIIPVGMFTIVHLFTN